MALIARPEIQPRWVGIGSMWLAKTNQNDTDISFNEILSPWSRGVKLISFEHSGAARFGAVVDGDVIDLCVLVEDRYADRTAFLEHFQAKRIPVRVKKML